MVSHMAVVVKAETMPTYRILSYRLTRIVVSNKLQSRLKINPTVNEGSNGEQ